VQNPRAWIASRFGLEALENKVNPPPEIKPQFSGLAAGTQVTTLTKLPAYEDSVGFKQKE
jgi:hypothetical protein